MKVFDFNTDALAGTYREQGWLHVRNGVTEEFLEHARWTAQESGALEALQGPAIKGAKSQYVYDFPQDVDWELDVLDVVAQLTGMRRESLVLSERHIKAYLSDADPWPPPHKDRFASGIALGVTLDVGPGSHVVLYPDDDTGTNPHLTTGLRDALLPEEQPEVTLVGAREVALHDAPGDVLAFPGSSVWHLRRLAAATVLVYLKFNDMDCDPLGEDPTTAGRSQATRALVDQPARLLESFPVLARRFDSVGCETGRGRERPTWHVNVWEDEGRVAHAVPGPYADLANQVDGTRSVAELADVGASGLWGERLVEAVRALARRGALDLLPERVAP
jgi:hypothetical protein